VDQGKDLKLKLYWSEMRHPTLHIRTVQMMSAEEKKKPRAAHHLEVARCRFQRFVLKALRRRGAPVVIKA